LPGGVEMEGILVEADNSLKISDFGRAAVLPLEAFQRDSNTEASKTLYPVTRKKLSPAYTTPEMFLYESDPTPVTDIWTLGVILYSMTAGFMPFDSARSNRTSRNLSTDSSSPRTSTSGSTKSPDSTPSTAITGMITKISEAKFEAFPSWFSSEQCALLASILVADPHARPSLQDINESLWMTTVVPDAQDTAGMPINTGRQDVSDDANGFDTPVEEENSMLCAVVVPYVLYVPTLSGITSFFSAVFPTSNKNPEQKPSNSNAKSTSKPAGNPAGQQTGHNRKQLHVNTHEDEDSDFDEMGGHDEERMNANGTMNDDYDAIVRAGTARNIDLP
jgi:hypothetical protein